MRAATAPAESAEVMRGCIGVYRLAARVAQRPGADRGEPVVRPYLVGVAQQGEDALWRLRHQTGPLGVGVAAGGKRRQGLLGEAHVGGGVSEPGRVRGQARKVRKELVVDAVAHVHQRSNRKLVEHHEDDRERSKALLLQREGLRRLMWHRRRQGQGGHHRRAYDGRQAQLASPSCLSYPGRRPLPRRCSLVLDVAANLRRVGDPLHRDVEGRVPQCETPLLRS